MPDSFAPPADVPLSGSADGAVGAVGALYTAHHSWLLGFLHRRLGNRDNASDLAHDAFERLMHGFPADVLHQPRAYLTTVAKNLLASHFRRTAVERAYLDTLAGQAEATAPSPESRALILEALETLCTLIDSMDVRTRSIFLLAQLDGLKYPEIAARLDISLDVVKKSMSKALQRCYIAVYE